MIDLSRLGLGIGQAGWMSQKVQNLGIRTPEVHGVNGAGALQEMKDSLNTNTASSMPRNNAVQHAKQELGKTLRGQLDKGREDMERAQGEYGGRLYADQSRKAAARQAWQARSAGSDGIGL